MPVELDKLRKEPEFQRMTGKEQRQLVSRLLDTDPEFNVLAEAEKAPLRNRILSTYGQTERDTYLAAPLTDPLGDPGKVAPKLPKKAQLVGNSAKVAQKPVMATVPPQTLSFRQKYVKPADALTEASFAQFNKQYLTEGSGSTPAQARDYLRSLPLAQREAALEAHPQYRQFQPFTKKAVLRSSYVLDNDAQTMQKEAAKRAVAERAALIPQQARVMMQTQQGLGAEPPAPQIVAQAKGLRNKAAGIQATVDKARGLPTKPTGNLVRDTVPFYDEARNDPNYKPGMLEGFSNEMTALADYQNLAMLAGMPALASAIPAKIGQVAGKAFFALGAKSAVDIARDQEGWKRNPDEMRGRLAASLLQMFPDAVSMGKKGIAKATEGIVPDVNMSGIGEGIPASVPTVKPKVTVAAKSRPIETPVVPEPLQSQPLQETAQTAKPKAPQIVTETPKPANMTSLQTDAPIVKNPPNLTIEKPPAQVTQGEPAVSDMSRMRMRDVESFAAASGIPLDDKANWKETNQQVAERAAKEYDDILHSIRDYDPAKNALATAEERFVAGARLNEIARELNTAQGDDATRLVNEATKLAKLSRQSASQLGRDLQFQKIVLGNKTDPESVIARAFMVTDGNLSEPARKSLYALAEKAQAAKGRIDAEVSQRASTGQDMRPKRTPVSKQERDAAVSSLRGKMARTNALADFGISLADSLPDLVTIGKFALQEKKRSFSDWAAEMKAAVPEADDADIREVWAAMGKGVQPKTLQKRATETLAGLGNPPKSRPNTTPESLALDKAYADGATDLNRFARQVRAKLGDKVTDAQLQTMFRDAAIRYRENYKELDDIKAEMAAIVQKELYRAKNPFQKAAVWAGEASRVPSTLLATIDMSGLLRQGGIATITQTRKAGIPATKEMFNAARSEQAAKGILDSIKTGRANSKVYEEAKLDIVDPESPNLWEREENFLSNLIGKAKDIRVIGVGARAHLASERAYATVGNVLRAEWFDTLYDPKMTPEQARDIARLVNIGTGRGDFSPKVAQGLPAVASVIWSPRFMLSRVQYLAGVPLFKASSAQTRKLIAKEYVKYYSKVIAGVALAKALGAEVEIDPRSKDFAKVKIGRVELDPFSGLRQYIIEPARAFSGEKVSVKSNAQGRPERKVEANDFSRQMGEFAQGKATPFAKIAIDLTTAPRNARGERIPEDFKGEPYTGWKVARQTLVPISLNNLYEGFVEFGYKPDVAKDLAIQFSADFFGMSTNVRDRDKEARDDKREKDRQNSRPKAPARRRDAPFSLGKLFPYSEGA